MDLDNTQNSRMILLSNYVKKYKKHEKIFTAMIPKMTQIHCNMMMMNEFHLLHLGMVGHHAMAGVDCPFLDCQAQSQAEARMPGANEASGPGHFQFAHHQSNCNNLFEN